MEDIEANTEYCVHCKTKPCKEGCPLNNDIPAFINLVKEKKYKEAFDELSKTTIMPFICGKICPQSKQCEGKCTRGKIGKPVSIGEIESFVGDMAIKENWHINKKVIIKNGKKIAIVGGGPAGITASIYLAKLGWDVTIFEKREKIGGILRYGIPDFRLDKKNVDALEEMVKTFGITIKNNSALGKSISLDELIKDYNTILLSVGANLSCKMNIPGEDLPFVLGANELLEYNTHPIYKGKKVIVIGGGNVAMDTCRLVKKLGASEVIVAYRRSIEQMPAEPKEIKEAMEDGVNFLFQTNIKKIEKSKVQAIKTKLVEKEGESRLVPVEIPESLFELKADYIIMAIGSKLNQTGLDKIEFNNKGFINVDDNYETSIKHIYAAGDNIGKGATVAWACHYAIEAAKCINERERSF